MYRPIFRHVERRNNCLAFRSVEEIDALATHVYYDLICRGRFATDIIGQHPFVGIRIPGGNKCVVNLFDKDELVIACRLKFTIQTITLGGGFALLWSRPNITVAVGPQIALISRDKLPRLQRRAKGII